MKQDKNYKILGKFFKKRNLLKIIIQYSDRKEIILFRDKDIFSGDYWNTITINFKMYDINFYKYEKWELAIYPVENNRTDYSSPQKVKLAKIT